MDYVLWEIQYTENGLYFTAVIFTDAVHIHHVCHPVPGLDAKP